MTGIALLLRLCANAADSRIKLLRFYARPNARNLQGVIIRDFMPGDDMERVALVEPPKSKKRKRESKAGSAYARPEY